MSKKQYRFQQNSNNEGPTAPSEQPAVEENETTSEEQTTQEDTTKVEEKHEETTVQEESAPDRVQIPWTATPSGELTDYSKQNNIPNTNNDNEKKEDPAMSETMPRKVEQAEPPKQKPSAESIVAPKKTILTTLTSLVNKYSIIAKDGLITDDKKDDAVKILVDIYRLVSKAHDRSVFDSFYAFMYKNRGMMVSNVTILHGIIKTKCINPAGMDNVIDFFVVFQSLVEAKSLNRRFTINLNHVRDIFKNKTLTEWLADQRK